MAQAKHSDAKVNISVQIDGDKKPVITIGAIGSAEEVVQILDSALKGFGGDLESILQQSKFFRGDSPTGHGPRGSLRRPPIPTGRSFVQEGSQLPQRTAAADAGRGGGVSTDSGGNEEEISKVETQERSVPSQTEAAGSIVACEECGHSEPHWRYMTEEQIKETTNSGRVLCPSCDR